ncbi:MAG: T9SS C-terminal target domain-containing protein, partial [Saprospiraceae bacterium]|nr:T9SS C-terminal target domain-containing protein [Saprospiraceae bacterium]
MKKAFLLLTFIVAASIAATAQIVVSGNITANTTWTKNNVYLLSGFVYVKNDATLTIEPGTVIKGDKNTKGSLIVTRGCKIVASGTPDEPIVFTSNEATPTYGDWGGVIICGKAPTNASNNGVDGEGLVEGGVGELYGGNDPMDNSGVLRYVRIEYAGIAFQPNNEINGLTMGGVGAGTTIEYVQVSYANDDAFEWFGGTVNCKYLIAYRALDDDFDCD